MTEPWRIPAHWRWSLFNQEAHVASNLVDPGGFPDAPHIAPNHIEARTGRLLPYSTVRADGVTSPKHRFHSGQVLYSKIRPYLAKVVFADFDGLCSADMYPIESSSLNPRFLKWWMLHPEFTRRASGDQTRTVLPKINKRALGRLPVPVPPIVEQHRIVEILEDHLSRLDAGVTLLESTLRRSRALVKSVLLDAIPDIGTYPDRWRTSTVDSAGRVELGRQRHPDWHTGPNMKPYLRVANVFEDRIDTSDVMEMHWPDETFDRFRLHPGDVLLNEGQSPEWLGRPAIYRGVPKEVAFTNSLLRFQAGEGVLPEFALLVFRRHMHAGRFARESRITTNIAHLSARRLKAVEFPVPPVSEQQEIVERVRDRLAGVGRLTSEIQAARSRESVLRRALLAAAFSGRLTGTSSDAVEVTEARLATVAKGGAVGRPELEGAMR